MIVQLLIKFSLGILEKSADYILSAAEEYAELLNPRLPEKYVERLRTLLGNLRTHDSNQKAHRASVGNLTQSQQTVLADLLDLVAKAKNSAKRAFKGSGVKLRAEFQVGVNNPNDLANVIKRARAVADSCASEDNAAALATKGWLASDTKALHDAIEALDTADDTQETAKGDRKLATSLRNQAANELFEGLLTIQNAADIQWPDSNGENISIRSNFRLGVFPPRVENGKKSEKTPAQPTTPTPPA